MGKRAALVAVIVLVLGGLLWWRVQVQEAARRGPPGGSTTVEGTETVVESKIAGRLIALSIREGDRVEAGQVVGELECKDPQAALAAARAQLAAARAQSEASQATVLQAKRTAAVSDAQIAAVKAQEQVVDVDQEKARIDLGRTDQLHSAGAVSDATFDTDALRAKNLAKQRALVVAQEHTALATSAASQAAVRTAEAQVAAADAQIAAANAEVERAQLSVDECKLVAPRTGFVTERLHEPGAVLPAGASVATVLDLSIVKALFFVPDSELGHVAVGAPAELRVDAYPGRVFTGRIRRINAQAEFTPRDVQTREDRDRLVYAVEVELQNKDGALHDGMPGDVSLPASPRGGRADRPGRPMNAGPPMLEARGLRRRFGAVTALAGIDLHLEAGELVGLVGPDGAGKSTLLRALTGLIDIDGGEARILGVPWPEAPPGAREDLGYMPQQYSLYTDLSVDENLRFFGDLFDIPRAVFQERRARLLAITQLEKARDRPAGALSGGMYKKLAVACALLHQPKMLVLDEPTNGVDPQSRRELWALLYEFVNEGMGVLVATPYMDEAARCGRVALLHAGRVLAEGASGKLGAGLAHVVLDVEAGAGGRGPLDELLEGTPGVRAVTPAGERIRVLVDRGTEAALSHSLAAYGARASVTSADFEDVYLSLLASAGPAAGTPPPGVQA